MNLSVAYHSASTADTNNHRHSATSAMSTAAHSGPNCYRLLTLIGMMMSDIMVSIMNVDGGGGGGGDDDYGGGDIIITIVISYLHCHHT